MSEAATGSDLTAKEFYGTVTGEERGKVSRVFKTPLGRLGKDDPEAFIEALVFLDLCRQREPDAQAVAHRMTTDELSDYFPAKDPEGDDAGEA